MRKIIFIGILLNLFGWQVYGQNGCTDPQATNYNSAAITNDGSCEYPFTLSLPTLVNELSNSIAEASGLTYEGDDLWVINDSGNKAEIYRIDTVEGGIQQTVAISGASNIDWEDMAEDDRYFYIGDFGNNFGNRTNLRIFRILKERLNSNIIQADTILFAYNDQTDFTSNQNDHNFDCEAFFVMNDSLHLFSKNWVNRRTRHYVLPATPGNHIATLRDEFDVQGLITAADINEEGVIGLLGYSDISSFMWLLYDYPDNQIFDGNKRRIALGSIALNGQTEGLVFTEEGKGFIASERLNILSLDLEPRLLAFETAQWTQKIATTTSIIHQTHPILLFPNPFSNSLFLKGGKGKDELPVTISLYDGLGRLILQENGTIQAHSPIELNTDQLAEGSYFAQIVGADFIQHKIIVKKR